MAFSHPKRLFTRLALTCALAGAATVPALAISVTLDGRPVPLNPAPLERAGRVFVPLRGIFERLGATVVYANGTINATGNSRTIALHIGSTQAVVDGQPQILDVAPFIVGASTYVPLRFISQALGATVNYDGPNQLVALISPSGGAPNPAPPPVVTMRLRDRNPPDAAFVQSTKPLVSATFPRPVDPNSVRVFLDGLDVTSAATRSETGIVYAPPSPLQSMQHVVRVTGVDRSGASFDRSWTFTSGTSRPVIRLELSAPVDGQTVRPNFTVSGQTAPNARIHIVAGASAQVDGGLFTFGTGTYTGDLIADGSGAFSQTVQLQTVSGAQIGLTVTATDPTTRDTAQRRLRLTAR